MIECLVIDLHYGNNVVDYSIIVVAGLAGSIEAGGRDTAERF